MMEDTGLKTQPLILIEFLVDQVKIPNFLASHNKFPLAGTCVSFQFLQVLNLPEIKIYQELSVSDCTCLGDAAAAADVERFRRGKSCLFSLPPSALDKPFIMFPILMTVYKILSPGVLPNEMLVGSQKIDIKDLVNYLLAELIVKNNKTSRAIKDSYNISTPTGEDIGSLTVYLRASCLGEKIITHLQMPQNHVFLFKSTGDTSIYECKRISSNIKPSLLPEKCICQHDKQDKDLESYLKPSTIYSPTARPPCPGALREKMAIYRVEQPWNPLPPAVKKCGCPGSPRRA